MRKNFGPVVLGPVSSLQIENLVEELIELVKMSIKLFVTLNNQPWPNCMYWNYYVIIFTIFVPKHNSELYSLDVDEDESTADWPRKNRSLVSDLFLNVCL